MAEKSDRKQRYQHINLHAIHCLSFLHWCNCYICLLALLPCACRKDNWHLFYHFEKKYDVIISNPPFYENELKSVSSKKNVAHHGENLSLQDLLTAIKQNLNPCGLFFLLLPFKRDEEIRNLVYQNKMQLKQITLVRQSVHHSFFRIMIMGTIAEEGYSESEFDEISIWDEYQQYTEEFVQLLKDYYLYL